MKTPLTVFFGGQCFKGAAGKITCSRAAREKPPAACGSLLPARFLWLSRRSFSDRFTLDQKDLSYMREVEVVIERCAAPNAPRLDAAMIGRRDLDEIRRAALLKQQGNIAFQRRLNALDRKK